MCTRALRYYKYTVIVIMLFVIAQDCFAQDKSRPFKFVQVDFIHSDPLDRFDVILEDRKLNGLDFSFLRQFKNRDAWFAGLSFSSATLDRLSSGAYTTKSGFWDIAVMLRHYPKIGFWRIDPYLQVYGGVRRLSTVTTREISQEETEIIPEKRTATPIFGVGFGTTIRLLKSTHLNLTSSFLTSGATTYLIATDESFGMPIESFEEVFSITNTLRYQVGLTFQF